MQRTRNKIKAIKFIREATGADLKHAKYACDSIGDDLAMLALEIAADATKNIVNWELLRKSNEAPVSFREEVQANSQEPSAELVRVCMHAMILKYGDEIPAKDIAYKAHKLARECVVMSDEFEIEKAFRE